MNVSDLRPNSRVQRNWLMRAGVGTETDDLTPALALWGIPVSSTLQNLP
jgi:hypothetical protein